MKLSFAVIFSLFFSSAIAKAGDGGSWSSGGSELFGDTRNPWFLSNTRNTSYCILLDNEASGVSLPDAEAQITRALKFWQSEFSYALLAKFPDFGQLRLATQVWEKRTCANPDDQTVDLKFQFGVLNQEQEDYMKTPARYAAISVLTNYDRALLKGKGFIYISPVKGRLAYSGALGKPDLWSKNNGINLYWLLLHELGHVYGLPHMGTIGHLMSEGFAESVIDSDTSFDHFFGLPSEKRFCPVQPLDSLFKRLFSIPEGSGPCLRMAYTHDPISPLFKATTIEVFVTQNNLDPGILVGTGDLTLSGFIPIFMNYIWLSPMQKIFSSNDLAIPGASSDRIPGISLMRFTKKGVFHPTRGSMNRSISIGLEQGNPMIYGSGVLDNELYESIF